MNRLQSELNRLYLGPATPAGDAAPARLVDAQGRVRALVMEVVQPAGWDVLSAVWRGVQADLELPAPAIAVSGTDGLQLWFSLETPIAAQRAHAFLESLRARFLADVPMARIRLLPDLSQPARHAALVPALQAADGNWSAFVSPDLAAIFVDTPWLDVEPGEEGQAALLRPLQSMKPASLEAAVARLGADAPHAPAQSPAQAAATTAPPPAGVAAPEATDDPRRFLLRIMNDESVALALRIEAAKALLPGAARQPGNDG